MQIKKEEVKDKLIEAGVEIFQSQGFEKASLRVIVKKAGTTLGNFYNYFKSKEDLYSALVDDDYKKFTYFLDHHEDHGENILDLENHQHWQRELAAFVENLLPIFTPRFILLIDKSEGTKYEGFKEVIIDFFKEHFLDHVNQYQTNYHAYAGVLSRMFVNGLIDLIKENMYDDALGTYITKHFMFFIAGTIGLIKNNETGGHHDRN